MNRRNLILGGVLVLQLIVATIVLWPRATVSGIMGEPLFPEIEVEKIVGLTITDVEGKTISLGKTSEGWGLPQAGDYPAEEANVTELLTKVVGLNTDRLVAQTKDSHKRLKVAESDYERLLAVELADGSRHELYVGSSPTFRATHVRAADQSEVYLTSDLTAYDASVQATNWVNQSYFSIPSDDVVGFALQNQKGTFSFRKVGNTWMMENLSAGEAFAETKFAAVLNRATTVSLTEPLGKEEEASYGLQSPSAVVTLETLGEGDAVKTYTLRVGSQEAVDNSYVVVSSESPYYVRVNEYAVSDLVEKGHDDFLELPPTAMPAAPTESTP